MPKVIKRILVVVPSVARNGGGVTESVLNLSKALQLQNDLSIEIVSCLEKKSDKDDVVRNFDRLSIYKYWGPSNFRFSLGLLWRVLIADADVIHVHGVWMFHCLAVYLRSLLRGTPYLVSPHGMLEPWILQRSKIAKSVVTQLYQRKFLKRAYCLHALNEPEKRDLQKWNNDAVVVPNFVEPSLVDYKPRWISKEHAGKNIYLFLGRIHEKKGCLELLEGWRLACRSNANFHQKNYLVFLGWNDGLSSFEDTVSEIYSEFANVGYYGSQYGSDKWASLTAATFFILPSKSEGLPMAVLEAWATGRPVLMTQECNLAIGFEYGAAAEISSDPRKLKDALITSSAWEGRDLDRMGRRGVELIEKYYSATHVVAKFSEIFSRSSRA